MPRRNSLLLDVGGTVVELPLGCPRAALSCSMEAAFARFGLEFRSGSTSRPDGSWQPLAPGAPAPRLHQRTFGAGYTWDELLPARRGRRRLVYLGLRPASTDAMLQLSRRHRKRAGRSGDGVRSTSSRRRSMIISDPCRHGALLGHKLDGARIYCDAVHLHVQDVWDWSAWAWTGGRGRSIWTMRPEHQWSRGHRVGRGAPRGSRRTDRLGRAVEERTGLHEYEFIETRRHWFAGAVERLPAGRCTSPTWWRARRCGGRRLRAVLPRPASPRRSSSRRRWKRSTIRPAVDGERCGTITAHVRGTGGAMSHPADRLTARGLRYGGDWNPERWPDSTLAEDLALVLGRTSTSSRSGCSRGERLQPSPDTWRTGPEARSRRRADDGGGH